MEEKCIKTNAPIQVVYDMFKHIKITMHKDIAYFPINLPKESYRYQILNQEIRLPKEPNYTLIESKEDYIPRFFPNPEPNWGPKSKAKSYVNKVENINSEESKIKQKNLKEDEGTKNLNEDAKNQ